VVNDIGIYTANKGLADVDNGNEKVDFLLAVDEIGNETVDFGIEKVDIGLEILIINIETSA
jgi:hypothetical protein